MAKPRRDAQAESREDNPQAAAEAPAHPHLESLPLGMRILLFVVGWALVAIGVAGLALPGIQGILTIVAGASVLSLVSRHAHELLERLLGRWPRLWSRIVGFQRRIHARLRRRRDAGGDPPPPR